MAVPDYRLSYALLDSLSECNNVNNNYVIYYTLPSKLFTINNPSCEIKLSIEVVQSLPEECDSKIVYGNIIWQNLNDGRFAYVQSVANKLTIKSMY